MNICFIAWEQFGVGGVSRVLTRIMNALSQEHDISVYCLKQAPLINAYGLELEKIKFFHTEMNLYEKIRRTLMDKIIRKTPLCSSSWGARLYASLRYTHSFKKNLQEHINTHQYDLVIFSSGFEDSLLLALIQPNLLPSIKTAAWSHTSYEDYFTVKGPYFARYFTNAIKIFYHRFNHIVVLSDDDEQSFKREHQLLTKRIYNPNSFTPLATSDLSSKTFVFVGSLSRHKGADLLLEAFHEFVKTNNEWHLHIYGDGPLQSWMEDFIKMHHLQNLVHMHGKHARLEEEFPQHTIFLFPSRYEGFGLVQVEAMSCGLPVIASDIPICRELVASGRAGILFPAGNIHALCAAMQRMSQEDLQDYSTNAKKQAQCFSIEKISQEWHHMLQCK